MDQHAKLMEMVASSKEHEGVVAYAPDGRAFFLTKDDARRTAVPRSQLHSAFQALQRQSPPPASSPKPNRRDPCAAAWHWLETHSPHSAHWRRVCLTYFEVC